MKLNEPLFDNFVIPRGEDVAKPVFEGILEGFWPFKPRSVRLFMDFDIDYNQYRILSEVCFGDFLFPHTEPVSRDDVLDDPYGVMLPLGQKFKEYYRHLEPLPNTHQHHLGEE